MGSETPIIPIRVGSEERVFELTKELFERGIFVNPVVTPGSPVGLLRTSYMATHEQVDLAQALSTFTELAEGLTALSKD
jgi:7-keto-8-aminopelargonate synthetase-like enzyme